jgi:transposase
MATYSNTTLESLEVGALPVVGHFLQRLRLHDFFERFLPAADTGCPEKISCSITLTALVAHLLLARHPLYAIPDWFARCVPEHLGLQPAEILCFNDDRLGRALERLFAADCASLLTSLVLHTIRAFAIDLAQFHNDSTTVTFSGNFASQAPADQADRPPLITHGYNKDHRPDLKQLLYDVTVSADGAVPVHFKTYDGNTSDDETHIDTWLSLLELVGHADFLYVADSKLCSHANLGFIAGKHGRFLTVLPRTWKETTWMEQYVQQHQVPWLEVRRDRRRSEGEADNVYEGFEYPQPTSDGYRLLWYRSSVKQGEDAKTRERCLERFRNWYESWRSSSKATRFGSEAEALRQGEKLLREKRLTVWARMRVNQRQQITRKQVGPGRPGPNTAYQTTEEIWYELSFEQDQEAIAADARCDGLFCLISNDAALSLKDALAKYKYQPFLEKRFEQLKTVFEVMPMWLKKPERITGLLFIHYVVLLVQALLEREVRQKMAQQQIATLPLYPEQRPTSKPTTELVLAAFEGLRRHRLCSSEGDILHTFHDPLSPVARQLLLLLGVSSSPYGPS